MSADQDDPNEGVDHRFVSTQRVRVPAKNPQIERKADLRQDSDTVAVADSRETAVAAASPSESLYDRLARTDELGELGEAYAQVEAVLRAAEPPEALKPHAALGPSAQEPLRSAQTRGVPARPAAPPDRGGGARARASTTVDRPGDRPAAPDQPRADPIASLQGDDLRNDRRPTEPAGGGLIDEEETVLARPRARADRGALPRARLVGGGTKAAGVEMHRQKILREARYPDLRAGPLKVYGGALTADQLHRLDAVLAGEHDDGAPDGAVSAKRALEHLLHDRTFTALPLRDRVELLRAVCGDQPGARAPTDEVLSTAKAALAVSRTGLLSRLDPSERDAAHAVFRTLDADGRARFAHAAARDLDGRSALEDRDDRDRPLVAHLRTLTGGPEVDPVWSDRGLRVDAVAGLVVGTIAQPHRLALEEGDASVAAVLEFALAAVRPAELTRLWVDVLARPEAVPMLGDAPRAIRLPPRHADAPTPLKALLLALADHHRPAKSAGHGFGMAGGRAIDAPILARVLRSLFGGEYEVAAGTMATRSLARPQAHGARMPVFVTILHPSGERLFVFDHLDGDHAYVRAPHGRSAKRTGDSREAPAREVVDAANGLDRIPRRAFEETVGAAWVASPGRRAE